MFSNIRNILSASAPISSPDRNNQRGEGGGVRYFLEKNAEVLTQSVVKSKIVPVSKKTQIKFLALALL